MKNALNCDQDLPQHETRGDEWYWVKVQWRGYCQAGDHPRVRGIL